MASSANEKYTALRSDIAALKDNPGLLALILDTLIDLDLLTEERLREVNSERSVEGRGRARDGEDQEASRFASNEEMQPIIWDTERPDDRLLAEVRRATQ